jgi:hypothetical protein
MIVSEGRDHPAPVDSGGSTSASLGTEMVESCSQRRLIAGREVLPFGGDGRCEHENRPNVVWRAPGDGQDCRPVDPCQIPIDIEHDATGKLIQDTGTDEQGDSRFVGSVALRSTKQSRRKKL